MRAARTWPPTRTSGWSGGRWSRSRAGSTPNHFSRNRSYMRRFKLIARTRRSTGASLGLITRNRARHARNRARHARNRARYARNTHTARRTPVAYMRPRARASITQLVYQRSRRTGAPDKLARPAPRTVSYTHLRAPETRHDL